MDTCCYLRLTDTYRNPRVILEKIAVATIIGLSIKKNWTFAASKALDTEIEETQNATNVTKELYRAIAKEHLPRTGYADLLIKHYISHNIRPMDATHLAIAQANAVDLFLTTDDILLERGAIAQSAIRNSIRIANPLVWEKEIANDN